MYDREVEKWSSTIFAESMEKADQLQAIKATASELTPTRPSKSKFLEKLRFLYPVVISRRALIQNKVSNMWNIKME